MIQHFAIVSAPMEEVDAVDQVDGVDEEIFHPTTQPPHHTITLH